MNVHDTIKQETKEYLKKLGIKHNSMHYYTCSKGYVLKINMKHTAINETIVNGIIDIIHLHVNYKQHGIEPAKQKDNIILNLIYNEVNSPKYDK